jgi:hypothetical protein
MTHRLLRAIWTAVVRLTGDSWLTLWIEERYVRAIKKRGYSVLSGGYGRKSTIEEINPDDGKILAEDFRSAMRGEGRR